MYFSSAPPSVAEKLKGRRSPLEISPCLAGVLGECSTKACAIFKNPAALRISEIMRARWQTFAKSASRALVFIRHLCSLSQKSYKGATSPLKISWNSKGVLRANLRRLYFSMSAGVLAQTLNKVFVFVQQFCNLASTWTPAGTLGGDSVRMPRERGYYCTKDQASCKRSTRPSGRAAIAPCTPVPVRTTCNFLWAGQNANFLT